MSSMLKRAIEKELLPCCARYNVGILPYFPLASGFLTGKYKRGQQAAAGTRFAVQRQRAETILRRRISLCWNNWHPLPRRGHARWWNSPSPGYWRIPR